VGVEVERELDGLVEHDLGQEVAALVGAGRLADIDEEDRGCSPAGLALCDPARDGGSGGGEDGALEVGRDVGAVVVVELATEVEGLALLDAVCSGREEGERGADGSGAGGAGGGVGWEQGERDARLEVAVGLPRRSPQHAGRKRQAVADEGERATVRRARCRRGAMSETASSGLVEAAGRLFEMLWCSSWHSVTLAG